MSRGPEREEQDAARLADTAGPFLTARALSKRFGRQRALERIDLEVSSDELLVVLGPTGSGKTTLLRTIAGLEQPDTGDIHMGGRDVTHWEPAARDVALVFQNFSLYPRWSVRQNLEFPLRAPGRNVPEPELQRRIAWAAELLKITRHLDRPASRLSGGEMQRVAIGRAIVRRPRLFLMDEPLTNLDAKLREALRIELVQLRRELATPMIFVTHDQAEALSMADRIVVLSEGRILQTGTPREIYERPVSPIVATQLGQPPINLLRVRRRAGQWLSVADGTPLLRDDGSGAAERTLGVRPEDITLHGTSRSPQGVVRVVEYTGESTTLAVDWAGASVHILVPPGTKLRPGDRVQPRIDEARAMLFASADAPGPDGLQRSLPGEPRLPGHHPHDSAAPNPVKEMP